MAKVVVTWFLDQASSGESPFVEVNSRILNIVAINGKLIERSEFLVSKGRRQVAGSEKLSEAQSLKPSPVLRSGFCNAGMANALARIPGSASTTHVG
jgi:hypothetical protein